MNLSWQRFVVSVCLALAPLASEAQSAAWTALSPEWVPAPRGGLGWRANDGDTTTALIPIDAVKSRWVRFGLSYATYSGVLMRINVYRGSVYLLGSIPMLCNGDNRLPRCQSVMWIPPDATAVEAVIATIQSLAEASSPVIEVASPSASDVTDFARVDAVLHQIQLRYYRSADTDWAAIHKAVKAIPAAPRGVDPLPAIIEYVRSMLPYNKHTLIVSSAITESDPVATKLPTCEVDAGVGVLKLPGIMVMSGEDPTRYAQAAHDCLSSARGVNVWAVDLRENTGGNMYPMISGVASLLPTGPLYAFVDGHEKVRQRIGISSAGVTVDDHPATPPTPDVGTQRSKPVVVIVNSTCGSSCEQITNALSARSRTLLVGQATAGYTTGNVPLALGKDYWLLLTETYTADPCGRMIPSNIEPDIKIFDLPRKSATDVLDDAPVAAWIASGGGGASPQRHCARKWGP